MVWKFNIKQSGSKIQKSMVLNWCCSKSYTLLAPIWSTFIFVYLRSLDLCWAHPSRVFYEFLNQLHHRCIFATIVILGCWYVLIPDSFFFSISCSAWYHHISCSEASSSTLLESLPTFYLTSKYYIYKV